jgi:hypothetical protein
VLRRDIGGRVVVPGHDARQNVDRRAVVDDGDGLEQGPSSTLSPPSSIERRQLSLPNPFAPSPTSSTGSGSGAGGLAGVFTNLGSALSGLGTSLVGDLQGPALALGIGIGSGAATGLNLTTASKAQVVVSQISKEYNVSGGADGLVMNLGSGLSSTIVGLIDPTSLLNTSSLNASSLQPYVISVGQGLGNGTASGLELSAQASALVPGNATGLPDLVGTLTFSLTKTLVQNTDLSNLNFSGGLINQVLPYLSPGGLGLGQGIGVGAQVVLKLQPDAQLTANWGKMANTKNPDVQSVTGGFAMALITSLFANVTLAEIMDKASSANTSGLTSNINIGTIAQGFARGFVQGAGDALQQYGGVQAIANNTAPMSITIPNTTVAFNDSIGGGGTGFGQGLGGQGVILVRQWLGGTKDTPVTTSAEANLSAMTSLDRLNGKQEATVTTSSSSLNLSQLLNTGEISALTQSGIDALTCTGVGGLAGVAVGLLRSGTISTDSLTSLNTSILTDNMFPIGIIRLVSGGNVYEVNTQALNEGSTIALLGDVRVNGLPVIAFGVLLVFHSKFPPDPPLSHTHQW